MGACEFTTTAKGKTAQEAFEAAQKQARYDHGHAGYTGTIAEKHSFVMIPLAGLEREKGESVEEVALNHAAWLMEQGDKRIDDKWGPAGCVSLGKGAYLFFGWARS